MNEIFLTSDNFACELLNSKVILFGAGNMAVDFIRKYGGLLQIANILDNDSQKWESTLWDISVKEPVKMLESGYENYVVVVCSRKYEDILDGLKRYSYMKVYVYNPEVDYIGEIIHSENASLLPQYNVGYVPGVYDLYHIGHLNLLKKSKERCKYLIVGVLTDELVYHFKKKYPYIPFEERFEIIKSIRYVDEVIEVNFSNTVKMDAWRQLKYDCHFSGDDHLADWDVPLKALRKVGSNMEFFQYTKTTSSSQIKKAMNV